MGFGQSISTVISKIGVFDGRASRSEFWWWYLLIVIVNFAVSILDWLIFGRESMGMGIIGWIFSILVLLISLSVGARRLHDTGKTGWLQLLILIPCVGFIILIVFWAMPSQAGDNQYGPAPTA
jgi:uncharacterized membrane protein YhaH (DUF805 family)